MGKRAIFIFSIVFIWIATALIFLLSCLFVYSSLNSPGGFNLLLASSSRNVFVPSTNLEYNPLKAGGLLTSIKGGDSKAALVEKFLRRHNSPMTGLGEEFVDSADRYGLDWRLLPAIAFQESNLGKNTPKDSHNPFGWASVYFGSWEEGINVVAAKIKEDYINHGLITPESIFTKYTSMGDPDWIFSVRSAMEEIANLEY